MGDFEVFENDEYYSKIEDSSFVDFFEYLKGDPKRNFIKYTENVCILKYNQGKNENIFDIPRLKWMILLRIIPIDFFSLSIHDCYNKICKLLDMERNNYFRSFNQNKLDISKVTSMDPLKFHPLSQIANNPWNEQHKNSELLDEIWKDITRTYSERQLFSDSNTRQLLQRILFTWTRENPELGYKQGMNEIAAILFLINYSQKIFCNKADSNSVESKNEYKGDNNFSLERIFRKDSIEADTYIMFNSVMNFFGLKYMFQSTYNECGPDDSVSLKKDNSNKPPIVHRCINIYGILEKVDYELFNHLYKEHQIEPQLIFLRWIRLLFSREFSDLNNSIIIWECIFCDALQKGKFNESEILIDDFVKERKNKNKEVCEAVESSLPIVNFIAVSILLARKNVIINSDFNHTLKLIVNQSNLSISPLEILSNAKSLCYGVSAENECANSPKLTSGSVFKDVTHRKALVTNQRSHFFENRDLHYSQIRLNPNSESESNSNAPKLNESLLEITKNLHNSAKNINEIEKLKCNVVSSCRELLRIHKILQEKNI
ncbi:TBC domain containing [Cryptosporidium sp. chipmunk genotype I]|uniref:TBC domain containing n=1 Tax=Cryptosporidium sp. chipmunk genotype I TaxID=1280935 RepID=UPI00351A6040|nr:TBC domain containing [Cryptosporidium sp. chipmunk genotype I]